MTERVHQQPQRPTDVHVASTLETCSLPQLRAGQLPAPRSRAAMTKAVRWTTSSPQTAAKHGEPKKAKDAFGVFQFPPHLTVMRLRCLRALIQQCNEYFVSAHALSLTCAQEPLKRFHHIPVRARCLTQIRHGRRHETSATCKRMSSVFATRSLVNAADFPGARRGGRGTRLGIYRHQYIRTSH